MRRLGASMPKIARTMAYTPLRISIPEPCHESWEGMTPVEGTSARHCDSCVKNVVDFTGFSDAQLHAFTKEKGANICGRFRPDQLGRPLRATHKPSYKPLKVAAAAAGLLLTSTSCDAQPVPYDYITDGTGTSYAPQDTVPVDTTPTTIIPRPGIEIMGEIAPMLPPDPADTIPAPQPSERVLMGEPAIEPLDCQIISTRTDEPEPTQQHQHQAGSEDQRNADRNHPPFVADSMLKAIEWPLAVVSPEQQDSEPADNNQARIDSIKRAAALKDTIEPYPPSMIMGRVHIERPRPTGLDSLRQMLRDTFSTSEAAPDHPTPPPRPRPKTSLYLEEVVLSPNPMVHELRIEINAPGKADLNIELLSASGQSIMSRPWAVNAGHNEITIEPRLARRHGIIFVRITDESGKRVTRPVVVKR